MIVWGGCDETQDFYGHCPDHIGLNTGGRYDPVTDSWTPTSTGANVPSPRFNFSHVWTGTELIIWGGCTADETTCYNSGSRYNPSTDTWTAMTNINAPEVRQSAATVWTGSEMIVWSGNPSWN